MAKWQLSDAALKRCAEWVTSLRVGSVDRAEDLVRGNAIIGGDDVTLALLTEYYRAKEDFAYPRDAAVQTVAEWIKGGSPIQQTWAANIWRKEASRAAEWQSKATGLVEAFDAIREEEATELRMRDRMLLETPGFKPRPTYDD